MATRRKSTKTRELSVTDRINYQCGWHDDPREVNRMLSAMANPLFSVAAYNLKGSGRGQERFLHEYVTKALGRFPLHDQEIGDCVSHGWGLAIDTRRCVSIAALGRTDEFEAEVATEIIYAGSRVEIGGGRIGGDGSVGAWAAKSVSDYGVVLRKEYKTGSNTIDFTRYSGSVAKKLGKSGIPDWLEATSKQYPVRVTSLLRSWEELCDAIYNGYPVAVCSNQGFSSKRDSKGFASPSGSWAHCMMFIAYRDKGDNQDGALCVNSWGPNWISGPKTYNQPEGSFWVKPEIVERMLRQDDSFAVSDTTVYIPTFSYLLG